MLSIISRRIGRYFCSNINKNKGNNQKVLFENIRNRPITNFQQAYQLIDGVYQNKFKLSYSNIKQMINKTQKILFHSKPNNKFIKLYLILSRLKLIDNFQRKVFVDKILNSVNDNLGDQELINTFYFLRTNCPYYDLSQMENYSLRIRGISEYVKQRSFNEYLFGMKTDLILKYLGLETKQRKNPHHLQTQSVGRVLAFPYCLSQIGQYNQENYQLIQKLMYIYLEHESSLYLFVQAQTNPQDTVIHDTTTFQQLALLYEIIGKMQFQSQLNSKVNSIFNRKIHQSQIDFMSSVRILKQIMPLKHSGLFSPIIKTILDIIWSIQKEQFVNLPIKSLIQFFKLLEQGNYKNDIMIKLQRVIVRMDMYEEEVEELRVLYSGKTISKQMKQLIKQD